MTGAAGGASLVVRALDAGYGDVRVLRGVSFSTPRLGITAIIGSNGAGKTTLLRVLSGLLPVSGGHIDLDGAPLTGLQPDGFVAAGVAHVPEGRRLFAGMTVEDNLLVGAYHRRRRASVLRRDLEEVYDLFPKLAERRRQDAVSMSGGEQQMCAIGRGLMAAPRLMLIDELSLGLAPVAVDQLIQALQQLAARGLAIIVVEQDVAVAFDLAAHAVVLDQGTVTAEGPGTVLSADPSIRRAYLGTEEPAAASSTHPTLECPA
jgi:branched-chain amino acid transport system ATP-binding protein